MIQSKPLHQKWLRDEWDKHYQYSIDSLGNEFKLLPVVGKDGKFETKDDISLN